MPSQGETWIITEGSVGMEAQGIAVAEAVGLPFKLKRVRVKGSMRYLPARLQIHVPPRRLLGSVTSNEPLTRPWPRLLISIGLQASIGAGASGQSQCRSNRYSRYRQWQQRTVRPFSRF